MADEKYYYRLGIGLGLVCALSACTPLMEGGKKATADFKRDLYATHLRVKEIFTYTPPPPPQRKPIPDSYCYRVMQDIVCYGEPQPGAEGRLVAYQGQTKPPAPETAEAAPDAAGSPPPEAAAEAAVTPPALASETRAADAKAMVPVQQAAAFPTPLTQTEEQRERTRVSMEKFNAAPPQFVGPAPAVKGETAVP